jgi:hypothetical protein
MRSKKEPLSEEELLAKEIVTPQDVLRLTKLTKSKLIVIFIYYLK